MSAFLNAAKALKKQNQASNNNDGEQAPVNFNLEEIFNAETERFHKLKDVLKYILDNLDSTKTEINRVDIKMQSKFMEISK